MFQDKKEELKRLETALLEAEEAQEEEFLPPPPPEDFDAYSNTPSDVDLEEYSQQVEEAPSGLSYGTLAFFLVFLTVVFCLIAWLVLDKGGYLG